MPRGVLYQTEPNPPNNVAILKVFVIFDEYAFAKPLDMRVHCAPAEGGPGPFYEKMGFVYTGEEEGGGLWMRHDLL